MKAFQGIPPRAKGIAYIAYSLPMSKGQERQMAMGLSVGGCNVEEGGAAGATSLQLEGQNKPSATARSLVAEI